VPVFVNSVKIYPEIAALIAIRRPQIPLTVRRDSQSTNFAEGGNVNSLLAMVYRLMGNDKLY